MNWNAIRGMRNRFAHGYGKMDLSKIFYTAIEDIPIIKDFIKNFFSKFKYMLKIIILILLIISIIKLEKINP